MLHVPPADVRPDAAFEQPRTNLQQIDAEEDKDDTAGSYTELMAELGQKVPFPPTPPPAPAQPCTRWGEEARVPSLFAPPFRPDLAGFARFWWWKQRRQARRE